MRRVVVTGLGFITSIGNSESAVLRSLREGRSGISVFSAPEQPSLPVHLAGTVPDFSFDGLRPDDWTLPPGYAISRENLRSMGPNAVYGYCAMQQAIASAGLTPDLVSHPRTGVMCASGGSTWLTYEHLDLMLKRGLQRGHPLAVASSVAGSLNFNLVAAFGILGAATGFSSACASSAHALGAAVDHLRLGRQDVVFVAGAEDCHLHNILPFACARALSHGTDPERWPCAFDARRDGFVVAGGGVVLVLEEMEHALRRGAPIQAEILGWGEASDGYSVMMPHPQGDGLVRAMRNALDDAQILPIHVHYLNAHATATVAGDLAELRAIKTVFRPGYTPLVSSTKSLTGHGLSLAGAMEAAFCVLALREKFVPVSAKIEEPDPECAGVSILTRPVEVAPQTAMSNASGFGGTNVSLLFRRWPQG